MRIIVLDIPGLGVRGLGAYGGDWIPTPNFDRLAADGIVFDNHYLEHYALPIPEGFTVFRDIKANGPPLKNARNHLGNGDNLWIACDALAEPWFAPEEVIEDFDDELPEDARFAAMLSCLDASFGELLKRVEDTVWIVTASRGEGALSVHEACAHVPLIVSGLGPARILELTTNTHFAIWFERLQDVNLLKAERITTRHGTETAIRTSDWTFIDDGETKQLFDRHTDRFETLNKASLHPEIAESL